MSEVGASAGASDILVSFRGVQKSYDGENLIVKDLNLDIRKGEFLTLLGPSGSGKTTSLMMLAGFETPTAGEILLAGRSINNVPPHKRDIGMVFQNYALFPHMDVAANIAYPLKLRGIGGAEQHKRVDAALQTVQLAGYGARRIDQLSGGQRQRVALARAIVFEPRIVLMDEPLSALDKQLRERMQIELRQLHEQLGTTTIYVTHDQREALTMSDRVAVVNGGRIVQLDTPRVLYEQPANRFVAEFIGESSLLPVQREGDAWRCAGQPIAHAGAAPAGTRACLMLRPERVRLLGADGGEGLNVLAAQVSGIVYQGDSFLLQARLADGHSISHRGIAGALVLDSLPAPGDAVRLGFAPADTVLLADED